MGVSHNAAPPRKLAIHQDSELKETTFLGHLAVTGVISGDRAATGRKETLRMMSRCAEKARWAPLLLLLALFGGGRAQTVEVCDLDNIATTAVPTEFWRPNYEGSVGSGTVTTVTLEEKDGAGTEVIVLKAIPLTHCEDQVRYFAREKLWSGVPPYVALTYYGVNSVTGIVTVNSGIANLRAIKSQQICFYVYTYYDIGTRECPDTARCIMDGCTNPYCCRDQPRRIGYGEDADPCEQSCDANERATVFRPVRDPDNTICNDELRDRDRVEVCVTVVDSNDPPSVTCPSPVNIIETASVGTRVTEDVSGSDPDPGLNGTIRYNLVQRLPDSAFGKYFEIDPISGVVFTAGILDFDRRSIYQTTVIVHDLGTPHLSASCDMQINVVEMTEIPPRFSHEVYSTCIDEIPSTAPASFANVQRQVTRVEAYNVNTGSTEGIQYELFTSTSSGQSLSGFDPMASVGFSLHDNYIYTTGPYDREEVSSYTFQVRAWHTDPTQSAQATVVVCVNDVNEPPRWPRSLYVTFVSEHPSLETEIYHLVAEDDDSGSLNKELDYSMVSDILSVTTNGDEEIHDTNTFFRVNSGGAIVVNQAISYENYRYFQFDVRVTDRDGQSDGLIADAEVFVIVVDVNDHEPTFSSANYSQILCENFPANTYHVPILATDPDHGTAGSLTFTLTGPLSNRFEFNPATPTRTYPHLNSDHVEVITQTVLNSRVSFDYEERQSYQFTIIAQDQTISEPLRAEAHAFAYICDRNDLPPVFDQPAYVTDVNENERTIIATIRVSDADLSIENQLSTLLITGGHDSNRFYLEAADEPNTWFLHVVDLDYENTALPNPRVINIMVTNQGRTLTGTCHNVCPLETLTAATTVTVTVHDVNDECPIFDPAHYDNINILENTAAGHVVTRLMASDADQSGTPQSTLAFYIKSNTGRGLFNVNEDTGVVTILNPPDFEEIHQITASFNVIDLGDKGDGYQCNMAEATVEIDIVNLNDNPPYWIGCPYYVDCISETVEENHFIVKVITMDVDWDGLIPADRAGTKVQYSIASQTRAGTFVINADTGVITVANSTLLDREQYAAEHLITVEATDGDHVISCQVTVLVCDANDNCPHFTTAAVTKTASVSEMCEGGNAGLPITLSASLDWTDIDVTDENRDTAYAIVDSDPPNAPFRIERYTGQLYVTSSGVDYEDVERWTLTVVVFDEANRQCPDDSTSYSTVVITVIDLDDTHIGFQTTLYPIEEISEGPTGNNVIIEELHNVDPTLVVSISRVEHCPPHWFEVVQVPATTGSWYLKVADLAARAPAEELDRERSGNVIHAFSGNAFCIINLVATNDIGVCHTFNGYSQAKAQIEIYDINDNPPVISTPNIVRNVPENAHVGYTIAHVAATDLDWGTNSELHFYLDPDQTDFRIDRETGALSSAVVFDHETQSTYTFQACAEDGATPPNTPQSACIDVTLTITDQQDHCPFLTINPLSVTRNEGDNEGDIGVSITATDRDSTGTIASLELLPSDSPFQLANVAGLSTSTVTANIHQSAAIDHEAQSVYHLTIVARDNSIASAPSCLDAAVVKVVIEDLPDEAPVLTAMQFSATLCEDAVGGEIVELHPPLDAVDLDIVLDTNQQDPDDTLRYTINAVAPTPQSLFVMNPVTHELQLAAGMQLDRETTTSYAYDVTVTDTNSLTATGRININICDVNDNPPVWDCDALDAAITTALAAQFSDSRCGGITHTRYGGFSCNFRVHVPEIAGIDCLLIGDVALLSYVSDHDQAGTPNSDIWLKVDHGDDEAIGLGLNPDETTTPIDPETVVTPSDGKLYIHGMLDYFKKPFHTLTLRAMDHGNPPMTGNVFFNVTLEACNRPPTCSSQNFTYCEETVDRVGLVTAMDENDGALGELTYTITSVRPSSVMTQVELRFINDNVEVWLTKVDYEEVQNVVIVVEASDGGTGSECTINAPAGATGGLRCTTTIEVVVLDINDNPPRKTRPLTEVHVVSPCFDENTIPRVFPFAGDDPDSGKNGEIFFQITQQDPPNIFLIHPDTGELWFENPLDYEEWCDTNFTVTVQTCDMGPLGENRFVCLNESWFQEKCSNTCIVQACLQGVDDNPPVCPHTLSQCIPEQDYSAGPLQLFQINCTDEDSSCPNAPATPFTYAIDNVVVYGVSNGMPLSPSAVTGPFTVDTNGFLSVIGNIDREGREDVHNDEYLIQMTVTDGATPTAHSTSVRVVVCVEEVNDEPPVCPMGLPMDFACDSANGAVYMSEDTDSPHQVISIAAHDPDLNPMLVYEIGGVSPGHADRWTVDETGAVIYTYEHVDYEELVSNYSTNMYRIDLRVRDTNTVRGTDTCNLTICIQLTDVNDNPPEWTQPFYNLSSCISESAPDNTFVFSMEGLVNDSDATSPNNLWEYLLEDPSASERALPFYIEPGTTNIRLNTSASLDYETRTEYEIYMIAVDRPGYEQRRLSSHATLHITLCDDILENPVIQDICVQAPENHTDSILLYNLRNVTITDGDINYADIYNETNPFFHYFLVTPPNNNLIQVDMTTGTVTLDPMNSLDYETPESRTQFATVAVRSSNYTTAPETFLDFQNSGFAEVKVDSFDINDNPPNLNKRPLYLRPGKNYILIPVDHLLEYGEPIGQLSATDIDSANNHAKIRYQRYDPAPGEPFYFHVTEEGEIQTAATFRDRIESTYNFTVEAYDNLRAEPSFNDFVMIKTIVTADERRVILTIDREMQEVTRDIETIVNIVNGVTGRVMIVDRIRHATSDDLSTVEVSETDVIFHCVEVDRDEITDARTIVHILDINFVLINSRFTTQYFIAARVFPSPLTDYSLQIPGLIIAIIVVVLIILLICFCCCVLCCWECRRRQSYKKKLSYLSFDEGKFITQNPMFVPPLETAETTEIPDTGGQIEYDVQEIAVEMDREEEDEDDWLKMVNPPEWLRRVEVEEYDAWLPPPVRPTAPLAEPVIVPEATVEEETHEEVVVERVETKQEVVVVEKVEPKVEVKPEPAPVMVRIAKPKVKEYDEQEQILQMFHDYDSEGVDSDAELRLDRAPSGMVSGDEDVEIEEFTADDFGQEAFQLTSFTEDFDDADEDENKQLL